MNYMKKKYTKTIVKLLRQNTTNNVVQYNVYVYG